MARGGVGACESKRVAGSAADVGMAVDTGGAGSRVGTTGVAADAAGTDVAAAAGAGACRGTSTDGGTAAGRASGDLFDSAGSGDKAREAVSDTVCDAFSPARSSGVFCADSASLGAFEPDLKRLRKLNMAKGRNPSGRRVDERES